MKAIIFEDFGGIDKLKMADIPTPKPLENEVQIEIECASVNPVDWKIREGMFKSRLPHEFPIVPGWDAAGTVKEVGKNVKKFKSGDKVFAYCRKPTIHSGTYAEFICVDVDHVARMPKSLNAAQAAAIPLVGLTAWQALFDTAKLKKGETILIHAGAGGVGSLAIQFAKNAGAKVFTTARENHHAYVKKLGANLAIDYTKEDFVQKVKGLIPQGVDVVLDCIGGDTLRDSLDVIKSGGRLVSIVEKLDPGKAKEKKIEVGFVFVAPNGSQLQQIADLIDAGKVVAPTIEEFPLEKASLAQEKVKSGHTEGKIVLKVK